MEFKKENIIAAYNAASDEIKATLRLMFPEVDFEGEVGQVDNRPIIERVKTFEDACKVLGDNDPMVMHYKGFVDNVSWIGADEDLVAMMKLRIICAALNEGWEPQFTEDEYRWYPWFYLWTEEELADKSNEWKKEHALIDIRGAYRIGAGAGFADAGSRNAPSYAPAPVGSRLCLKSESLARYCGTQFASLWADFYLVRSDND